MNNYLNYIESNPDILLGKPVIKGTRIGVDIILKKLSEGMKYEELLTSYPTLKVEDIFAALSYSADVISKEEVITV